MSKKPPRHGVQDISLGQVKIVDRIRAVVPEAVKNLIASMRGEKGDKTNIIQPIIVHSGGWHAENIKAEIRVQFGSLRAFALAINCSPQSVSGAILSPIKSSRIEMLIAEKLKKEPAELWPDRWTPSGEKISRSEFRRQLTHERAAV